MLVGGDGFFMKSSGGGVDWSTWNGSADGSPTLITSGLAQSGTCPGACCEVNTGLVVQLFSKGNGVGIYAVGASISGVTPTFGTPIVVAVAFNRVGVSICKMTTNVSLAVYINSANVYANVITSTGTAISVGSASSNINTLGATVKSIWVSNISATTAMVFIQDNTNGVTAAVVTISGTSVTSVGTQTVIDAAVTTSRSMSGVALSSTLAVAVYGGATKLSAAYITMSGATITAGNITSQGTIVPTGPTNFVSHVASVAIDATHVVWGVGNVGAGYIGVVDVSTSTPSFGAAVTLGSSQCINGVDVAYNQTNNGGIIVLLEGSGTTGLSGYGFKQSANVITLGSEITIDANEYSANFSQSIAILPEIPAFVTCSSPSADTSQYMTVLKHQ